VKKTEISSPPKRKASKAKIKTFRFNTPSARSIIDLGESAMIESAIRKAQGGTK
jgi:hypothetical protein